MSSKNRRLNKASILVVTITGVDFPKREQNVKAYFIPLLNTDYLTFIFFRLYESYSLIKLETRKLKSSALFKIFITVQLTF